MNDPSGGLFIGLMSGTSIDAVDGVLARFDAEGTLQETVATASVPIPDALRRRLTELQQPAADELVGAALAANDLADLYAQCVAGLLEEAKVAPAAVKALAAHGQTVRHDPARGYTLQLLNGARLAEKTRIDTVTDLRSADIAAGGQGAPLVPAFHARVFRSTHHRQAIVNIGGIANITVLGTGIDDAAVSGYDTGPGNTLLDAWCEAHLGERFDRDGQWAASGKVDNDLLAKMLAEPYFSRAAPKSTGRDLFNLQWLQRQGIADRAPADVQATLLALTCRTIADACRKEGVQAVHVCGGGAANARLMQCLRSEVGGAVGTTGELGLQPQAVEATAFAWLACRRAAGAPGNLPSVTGAAGPRVLGALYIAAR